MPILATLVLTVWPIGELAIPNDLNHKNFSWNPNPIELLIVIMELD